MSKYYQGAIMSNIDKRIIRTKKMIKLALSELIEEKGFNNVTITDIATRADINRGTFYLHYSDKYDLLEQLENEVILELEEYSKNISFTDILDIDNMDNIDNIDIVNKLMPFTIKLFEYLKENSAFMKALLGQNGDPQFHSKVRKLIKISLFEKDSLKAFDKKETLVPKDYFVSYVLSAQMGVIQQWLDSGMEKSPEEMALILAKLFFLGPFKVSGLENISYSLN
jgi:AcrR family transcriptional regulator